ncbi:MULTISPECIES: Tm-1-like ATP-binding domain-containing protein [unclassified Clostridium]|uniref:Tm-1-like ATP-binding domain-containing protein n=1 Tax=unclassified Clostridium TaxID=2614128 RepID=UPI0011060969|nr:MULTISPECIES: Tm-1-like ATP-binding domain-containing protein [unclassified Clostridium]
MTAPNIIVAGILDTKGREIQYLASRVAAAGGSPAILELSVGGEVGWADIGLSRVLKAVDLPMEQFYQMDRSHRAQALAEAASRTVVRLNQEGLCDGIIAFGGSMGATIAATAMRALPIGVPKMMLSTINGQLRSYAGTRDICVMYSVAEAGLNRVTRKILSNAAGAIVGMAGAPLPDPEENKPLVGCMMFGVTTPCVVNAAQYMEKNGYDVIIHHATGSGGRSFEDMIREGLLCGVLDITTHEVVSDLYGTRDTAGPSRLCSAADCKIPQVISLGGADFFLFEDDEPVPRHLIEEAGTRGKYIHNASVVNYGINTQEAYEIGCEFARRINPACAPAVLCIPMRGWCANDCKDNGEGKPGVLWLGDEKRPEVSARSISFCRGLENTLKDRENQNLEVLIVDRHINDREFSQLMAELLTEMLAGRWQKGSHTNLAYVRSLRSQTLTKLE